MITSTKLTMVVLVKHIQQSSEFEERWGTTVKKQQGISFRLEAYWSEIRKKKEIRTQRHQKKVIPTALILWAQNQTKSCNWTNVDMKRKKSKKFVTSIEESKGK